MPQNKLNLMPKHPAQLCFWGIVLAFGIFSNYLHISLSDLLYAFPNLMENACKQDFIMFYKASELIQQGQLETLFTPDALHQAMPQGSKDLLWLYPPHALYIFMPLSSLEYGQAKAVWLIFNVTCIALAVWQLPRKNLSPLVMGIALAVSPAFFFLMMTGQISGLIILLMVTGLTQLKKRPILAGIALGILTIKPQFGLIFPILLIAYGLWRPILIATLTSLFLVIASILTWGLEPWGLFVESLTSNHSGHIGKPMRDTFNLLQAFLATGAPPAIAKGLFFTSIMASIGGFYFLCKRSPIEQILPSFLLLTCLIAPSFWNYDWIIPTVAILMIISKQEKWNYPVALLAALVWGAPTIVTLIGITSANLIAIASLLLMFFISINPFGSSRSVRLSSPI